jgi:hypothetical protein
LTIWSLVAEVSQTMAEASTLGDGSNTAPASPVDATTAAAAAMMLVPAGRL